MKRIVLLSSLFLLGLCYGLNAQTSCTPNPACKVVCAPKCDAAAAAAVFQPTGVAASEAAAVQVSATTTTPVQIQAVPVANTASGAKALQSAPKACDPSKCVPTPDCNPANCLPANCAPGRPAKGATKV